MTVPEKYAKFAYDTFELRLPQPGIIIKRLPTSMLAFVITTTTCLYRWAKREIEAEAVTAQ